MNEKLRKENENVNVNVNEIPEAVVSIRISDVKLLFDYYIKLASKAEIYSDMMRLYDKSLSDEIMNSDFLRSAKEFSVSIRSNIVQQMLDNGFSVVDFCDYFFSDVKPEPV